MFETIEECRKEWEKTLTPLCVMDETEISSRVCVVLQDKRKTYHLHRYCRFMAASSAAPLGEYRWDVSVDGQCVPLEMVWKWLECPMAIHSKESEP